MTRRMLTDPTAVVARRGGAWFIDVVLCALAAALPALLLADAYAFDRPGGGLEVEWNDGDLGVFVRDTVIVLRPAELAVTVGAGALAVLVLLVLLPGRRGWSPGKLAADLRLVRRDGEQAGIVRALVRTVAWVVDLLPGIPLVAYASARLTRRHQRVGDLLARTYVVDKRAAGRPVDQPLGSEGAVAEPEVEDEPASGSGDDDDDDESIAVHADDPEQDDPAAVAGADTTPAAAGDEGTRAVPKPTAAGAGQPPAGVPADEPIWDRRHRRYVLWHSKAGRWLEHTDAGWTPLDRDERTSGQASG